MWKTSKPSNVVARKDLDRKKIDTGGRDLLIGFNEPAFKYSDKRLPEADLDSKLNARFVSYFLPAVQIAVKQKKRPRLLIVSGLNMAFKWNAKNDHQRKIMMIDNNLKLDFLRHFFEKFFPENFSIIEYIVAQDPVKISEDKLLKLWIALEAKYPRQVAELKLTLARFKRPGLFGTKNLSDEARSFLNSQNDDLINAFKYAISHLFALADINFEGNYVHNPRGYVTVGGPAEKTFNVIRDLALKTIADKAEIIFERSVIYMDNLRLVFDTGTKAPPPYNGYFEDSGNHKSRLAEVTYENGEPLEFYNRYERLKPDMDYIYSLIPKADYEAFWDDYRSRYFELKKRYREAYSLAEDF